LNGIVMKWRKKTILWFEKREIRFTEWQMTAKYQLCFHKKRNTKLGTSEDIPVERQGNGKLIHKMQVSWTKCLTNFFANISSMTYNHLYVW
jgi:hypothetical protein